jgi:hypothetical protein
MQSPTAPQGRVWSLTQRRKESRRQQDSDILLPSHRQHDHYDFQGAVLHHRADRPAKRASRPQEASKHVETTRRPPRDESGVAALLDASPPERHSRVANSPTRYQSHTLSANSAELTVRASDVVGVRRSTMPFSDKSRDALLRLFAKALHQQSAYQLRLNHRFRRDLDSIGDAT